MLPLFRFPAPAQLSGGLEGTDFPFAGFAGMLVVALALPTLSKQAVIILTFLFAVACYGSNAARIHLNMVLEPLDALRAGEFDNDRDPDP